MIYIKKEFILSIICSYISGALTLYVLMKYDTREIIYHYLIGCLLACLATIPCYILVYLELLDKEIGKRELRNLPLTDINRINILKKLKPMAFVIITPTSYLGLVYLIITVSDFVYKKKIGQIKSYRKSVLESIGRKLSNVSRDRRNSLTPREK